MNDTLEARGNLGSSVLLEKLYDESDHIVLVAPLPKGLEFFHKPLGRIKTPSFLVEQRANVTSCLDSPRTHEHYSVGIAANLHLRFRTL
jgi:hypothetical protein